MASINRPGGNVTGMIVTTMLVGKQFELLQEWVPHASVIGFLVQSHLPNVEPDTRDAQIAAQTLGRERVDRERLTQLRRKPD